MIGFRPISDGLILSNHVRAVAGIGDAAYGALKWLTGEVVTSDNGETVNQLDAEGKVLDAKLAAMNLADLQRTGDQALYDQREANRQAGIIDANDQVAAAAVQGAWDGLADMQNAVKKATGSVLGGALGFIPWWGYAALAVWAASELGLLRAGVRVARRRIEAL